MHGLRVPAAVGLAFITALNVWTMDVGLTADPPTTSVGGAVRWYPFVQESDGGEISYRFRVRAPGDSQFRMARDYRAELIWLWTPTQGEGQYEIELSARNRDTGEETTTIYSYDVAPRATGKTPVLTRTENALVALYSAPACEAGSRMRVAFTSSSGEVHSTPSLDCNGSRTMNVYLAGMRASTEYAVRHMIEDGQGAVSYGPELKMTTDALSFTPPLSAPLRPADTSSQFGVLLQNRLFDYSVATDLDGNVIWYIPENLQYLTRPLPGGYFVALIEDHEAGDSGQLFRVIDLAGQTVLETNARRVNDQLAELGQNRITSFHHEARRLPDGKFLVLAATERFITDVQGPGDVPVIGDMILLLSADLQVEWVWDAFDHLDVSRRAVLNETCVPRQGGCPVMRIASVANDWLHGNSLAVTPDGGILYSARHQDWVIKIDFANGTGSGDVIWRLGKDGDFQVASDDPDPWFSHQHDASAVENGGVLLFDNGNTRYESDSSIHSRGQVFEIDETSRVARLVFNADLGSYSLALGSAQYMAPGRYHFNSGWMPNMISQALEYDESGELVNQLEVQTPQYRSFRMRDLYTPE